METDLRNATTIVDAQPAVSWGAVGRGILLWLLGVPIPVIILLALFWH
jgi:hypothetical protein